MEKEIEVRGPSLPIRRLEKEEEDWSKDRFEDEDEPDEASCSSPRMEKEIEVRGPSLPIRRLEKEEEDWSKDRFEDEDEPDEYCTPIR
ncbi:unnamed protein product [Ilex paraguariensis]|uniref:Uncharacterized protein n=1 Tax=Ilex paraguariensis TaxID=185542 RepID=A0ABC8R850_9AQUA